MATNIEKHVSNLVEAQFPEFYREEGQMFIAFVKAYYEWLESSGQPLYWSRRLSELRDIDNTIDQFILRFKNKFLSNIQFNTQTNKKLFIKNALDFYRAKGTPRSVDLFFKLVYGLEARVYNPGEDLFKLSDNTWQNERYLEVIPAQTNLNFVGQTVFGAYSGASAFCERLVRVKKGSNYIEVLYLTGLDGDFQTFENVETKNLTNNVTTRINGSLTSFEILTSTDGFSVGEQVYVSDGTGKKAKAFVKKTTDYVGVVEFSLLEGGWGYTPQAEIIGSERSFTLDNITFEDTEYFYHTDPERQFCHIQQDLALIDVDPANTELTTQIYNLPLGETYVYAYTNNDPVTNPTPIFEGLLVDTNDINDNITINYTDATYRDSNGDIILDALNGIELFGNTVTSFWTGSNNGYAADGIEIPVETSDPAAITDIKAQANIIAWSDTFTIAYTGGNLAKGDIIYQHEDIAKQRYFYGEIANTFSRIENSVQTNYANIKRTVGFPRTNRMSYRTTDELEVTITNLSNLEVGCIGYGSSPDLQAQVYFSGFGNTYGTNTGFHSTRHDSASYTDAAIFQIDTFEEVQSLTPWASAELISTELDQVIKGAGGYANLTSAIDYVNENGPTSVNWTSTTLNDALSVSSNAVSIGSIKAIVVTSQGREYARDPFFIVYEPDMYHFERYDFYIKYKLENEQKSFRIGEDIITLNGNPESTARIKTHNPTTGEITAVRIHVSARLDPPDNHVYLDDDFRIGDRITGVTSDVSADIEVVDELRMQPRTGLNADILAEAFSGVGFATDIEVLDSGFGYFGKRFVQGVLTEGETLNMISRESDERTIQALGFLGKQGIAPGVHPNRKSFLSEDKVLADNDFYQEYSYQVLTALPFDKYKQVLVDVLHIAGTKPFGGYVGTSEVSLNIEANTSISEFTIKSYPVFVNEQTFFTHTAEPVNTFFNQQTFYAVTAT